MPKLVLDLT